MLEVMRRQLRNLGQLIDKRQRQPIYTDFEDLMGHKIDVELLGLAVGTDYARFLAKEAMATFMAGKALSANQIEFINLIVDHLTEHGVVEPSRLYESPFTDLTPRGPEGLVTSAQLGELMHTLEAVRMTALVA